MLARVTGTNAPGATRAGLGQPCENGVEPESG